MEKSLLYSPTGKLNAFEEPRWWNRRTWNLLLFTSSSKTFTNGIIPTELLLNSSGRL